MPHTTASPCHQLTHSLSPCPAPLQTLAEQQEVERAFVQRRALSPAVPFYWLGLKVGPFDEWPKFTWTRSGLTPQKVGSRGRQARAEGPSTRARRAQQCSHGLKSAPNQF